MTFTAGEKIRASKLNRLGTLVGRNKRTTNSASVTSIARVLSVRAPVIAGRSYRVQLDGEIFGSNGATVCQSELRYTTSDVEPTTTSPVLARAVTRHDSTVAQPDAVSITGIYDATFDAFLRVALCLTRVSGSVGVQYGADSTFPVHLTIEDVGLTVATSGTVY